MYDIVLSNRFKKDLKLAAKRGYNLNLLEDVVNTLARGESLSTKHRDHENLIAKKLELQSFSEKLVKRLQLNQYES